MQINKALLALALGFALAAQKNMHGEDEDEQQRDEVPVRSVSEGSNVRVEDAEHPGS